MSHEKKYIKKILFFISSVIIVPIAISIQPNNFDISNIQGSGINSIIEILRQGLVFHSLINNIFSLFVLYFLFSETFKQKRAFDPVAAILSFFYSLFMLIGDSFSVYHDFSYIIYSKAQLYIALIVFIGKWIMFYYVIRYLYQKISHYAVLNSKMENRPGKNIEKIFPVICFFSLIIFWSLCSAPFFPGNVPHDGRSQLNQFFHIDKMTTHHPVISTLFLGSIYKVGNIFGKYNGTLAVVIIHMISAAFIFTKICNYIKISYNSKFGYLFLAFYAIAPMWWSNMCIINKDTLYFCFFSFFSLISVKIILEGLSKKNAIELLVSGLLVVFFRNNGVYIILPSLFFLFLVQEKRKNKKIMLSVFLAVLSIYLIINYIITFIYDLHPANPVEALSVPLQQIARYASQYKDEITEEEASIIDNLVVYDGIEKRYVPEISDYVKNHYRGNITTEKYLKFAKLYLKFFIRHPLPFFEAAINHSFGYFDPEYINEVIGTYNLYNKDTVSNNDKDIIYSEYSFPVEIVDVARSVAYLCINIPVISLFLFPATYTWIILFVFSYLLRCKKFKLLSVLIAPLLNILICCLSPWNGCVRYTLPIMASMPLYVLLPINIKR